MDSLKLRLSTKIKLLGDWAFEQYPAFRELQILCFDRYFHKNPSIEDYVLRKPIPIKRQVIYYLHIALHLFYTSYWFVLMKHNDDHTLSLMSDITHSVFKVRVVSGASFYLGVLMLEAYLAFHYLECRHQIHYFELFYHVKYRHSRYGFNMN